MADHDDEYRRAFSPPERSGIELPWKSLGLTLGALTVWLILHHVPLPGIDMRAFMTGQISFPPQLSVMAIGLAPVLTAAAILQIAGYLVPAVSRSSAFNGRHVNPFSPIVVACALILVVFQGLAITQSLAVIQPDLGDGGLGRIAILAGLAGGTVIAIVIAQFIDRHGIGHGFWLVFGAGALISMARTVTHLVSGFRAGALSLDLLALDLAAALAVVIIFVFFARATVRGKDLGPSDLLWPIMCAGIAASGSAALIAVPGLDVDGRASVVAMLVMASGLAALFASRSLRGRLPVTMTGLIAAGLAIIPQVWALLWLFAPGASVPVTEMVTGTSFIALIVVFSSVLFRQVRRDG